MFSVIDGGFLNNVSKWIYILKAGGAKNNAELFLKNNILNEFGGLAASLLSVTGFYSVLGSIITRVANRFRNPAQQNGQPQAAPAQQNGQPQRTPAPAAPAQQNGQPQRTPAPAAPAQQNGQPQGTSNQTQGAQQNGPTIIQTPPRSNQNAQNIQNPTPAATHIATNLVQLLLNTNNDIPEAYRQITAELQNPNQSTQMKQQFRIIEQTLKDIATQNNIDLTQQPVRRHP